MALQRKHKETERVLEYQERALEQAREALNQQETEDLKRKVRELHRQIGESNAQISEVTNVVYRFEPTRHFTRYARQWFLMPSLLSRLAD